MKDTFKVGDVVVLKSGGPAMTVQEVIDPFGVKHQSESFRCQWFSGKKLESGIFPLESLNPSEVMDK
jgi:uncharacterized protein YodC (DUF2158 family)